MRRTKSVSEKQRAANLANAARSTGPRTPEGKARSSQNARKHKFNASVFAVIRLEDLHEIANLRADLVAAYQPVNSQELFALERLAIAQQSLLRCARLETGMFTSALNETLECNGRPLILLNPEMVEGDVQITAGQDRNYLMAEGLQRVMRHSDVWAVFLRYQAQTERFYRRAVEDFERIKRLRKESPNEPIFSAETEASEDTYEILETNPLLALNDPPVPARLASPQVAVPHPVPGGPSHEISGLTPTAGRENAEFRQQIEAAAPLATIRLASSPVGATPTR